MAKIAWLGGLLALAACQTTGTSTEMSNNALAEGTNRAFSHSLETSASADQVWQLWTEVSTWKDWDEGLKDAEMDGTMALGSKGRIIPLSGPSSGFEVTEFSDGNAYAFATRLPFARLIVRRVFVSREPTVFQHEVSFEGALAGFWASRFGPQFREALPSTMEALSALAETEESSK